jgi:hypothetical protein
MWSFSVFHPVKMNIETGCELFLLPFDLHALQSTDPGNICGNQVLSVITPC